MTRRNARRTSRMRNPTALQPGRGTASAREPLVGVVVISRNEERHIEACLRSVLDTLRDWPTTPVVLVDSNSTDDTVAIAQRFPITIYRYRAVVFTAAAGRRIGFERIRAKYVLFVDGDCCIEAPWLMRAIEAMESSPRAAVIYGARRDAFNEGPVRSREPAPDDYGLGGNALYRAAVLREVDGFNPFIVAEEEGELLGRIQAAGYHAVRVPEVMLTHHTVPKDTVSGVLRRQRRGLGRGRGQVLRLAIEQGLFLYHAHRFNRYLLTLAYLAAGLASAVAGALLVQPWVPLLWLSLGVLAFAWLWFRRGSLRSASWIASDWLLVAAGIVGDFVRRPPRPERFDPLVERVR